MAREYSAGIQQSPDPDAATVRLDRLLEDPVANRHLTRLPESDLPVFIHLISISDFLFRYCCRHPDTIAWLSGSMAMDRALLETIEDVPGLRAYKYQELVKITWLDLTGDFSYRIVLDRLSVLADGIILRAMRFATTKRNDPGNTHPIPFCIFGMGKLGAGELNYSSDVDLIFVSKNSSAEHADQHDYQGDVQEHIRRFSQIMQEVSEDGFLYRVDLKLRPWGRSGPLALSVDETELYYEASTEAWERFAWLRARIIGGERTLGEDLLERLEPFIYLRSLSNDDLQRFVRIKNDMATQRRKNGWWNVKLGEGGIRDIEFFIQMLQIVNAHSHPQLKSPNTLTVLDGLVKSGFLSREEGRAIEESYLFLRRLENRLQMIDEQQTHQLPENSPVRKKIASSLGFGSIRDEETLARFDRHLEQHRNIARACFERILPAEAR